MIKDTKIAKRYARALFDIASEDQSYNDWLDKLKLISDSHCSNYQGLFRKSRTSTSKIKDFSGNSAKS